MLDTVAISKTINYPPNRDRLLRNGGKPLIDRHTGECRAIYINSDKNTHEPRITISKTPRGDFVTRAEVSIPAWDCGSNLYLPTENDVYRVLDTLSEFVGDKTGISFDARTERVTRVDFTRDFQVGENAVIPIIANFGNLQLPRYKRICFDDTTVNFKNAGKERTKEFLIYSKYHERLAKSKDVMEQEAAKGSIRLENSFRKSGVARLAKSLKLKSHHANHILTKETSELVIQRAMALLHFQNLLTVENSKIEKLFTLCGATKALSRVGYLWLKDKYGNDLSKLPFNSVSQKTLKRCSDDCLKAGIMSLE